MKRLALISVFVVGAVCAQAQTGGFNLNGHIGYYQSSRFHLKDGSTARIQGAEVGLDMPFISIPGVTATLSPSVVFSTGNADGNLYRLEATARTPISIEGFYGKFGTGYAFTTARNGDFK